jgi:cytochrome c biogenesis protein CcmG, thiol:disulfide interchange protein DsbE
MQGKVGLAAMLCLLLAPACAVAASSVLETAASHVHSIQTFAFEADSTQTLIADRRGEQTTESIKVSVMRPGRVLWVQQGASGINSITTANGIKLFTYRPELNRYTEKPLTAIGGEGLDIVEAYDPVVAALMSNNPTERIAALSLEPIETGTTGIAVFTRALAREETTIALVGEPVPLPTEIVTSRTLGNGRVLHKHIRIRWDLKPDISPLIFEFTPPPGAELVDSFAQATSTVQPLKVGDPAPNLTLATPDGQQVPLSELAKTKVVVIDFWATWCHGCESAMQEVAELSKKYAAKPVEIFAINVKEEPRKAQNYLAERNIKLNVAFDPKGEAAALFRSSKIPCTFVIARDGRIATVLTGYSKDTKAQLEQAIDRALATAPRDGSTP